jgi:hypothetical protein
MLSTDTRLKLESICNRIENHEEVTFEEMTFIQKWSDHNRIANRMLNQARRVAAMGKPDPGSLDQFLNDLDLGDPDPSNWLQGPQNPVDLGLWFTRDERDDWRQRD